MQNRLIRLPRNAKQGIVIFADIVMSVFATWFAFSLRLDVWTWPQGYQWHVYQLAPLLAIPVFAWFGLYRAIFRYTGLSAMFSMAKAVALYGVILFALLVWFALPDVPRSLGILQPLLMLILVGASRAFARFWLNHVISRAGSGKGARILIYGAGSAGAQIAVALQQKPRTVIIGFLDDDPQLVGKTINGQLVHAPADLDHLISLYDVTDVLLALPTVGRVRRNQILASLAKYQIHIRSLPDLADLAQGKVTVSDIRELDIVDLLGRDQVSQNSLLTERTILGKTVLVSGAGGSIGSELCRQILVAQPATLLLLDHNEFSLYAIHGELQRRLDGTGGKTELVPLLGTVRDYRRMREICRTWQPQTVYHAAAYKHVPLVEHNPAEGIRNNVVGTYNLARAAIEEKVSDFVLISTDKAVRPTNVMGATKRLAELILQALSSEQHPTFGLGAAGESVQNATRFSMVRFGNVLGSSGSVVPLFRQQILDGGPITLTDAEVTRYFMTIPEAAQLVVHAAAMADGGDVFVLDMGEPVKIINLARRMIELSGLSVKDDRHPHGDIAITVTGLRPGEKLYEELLIGENPQATSHPRIMKAHEEFIPWPRLNADLQEISDAADSNDVVTIRAILSRLVNGYQCSSEVVDWIHLAESAT